MKNAADCMVTLFILALCAALVWGWAIGFAEGQDAEPSHLPTARVCWLEAGWSEPDCAAIHGVITRRAERAGVTYAEMLARYSAIMQNTARAKLARQLPDGDEPTWHARDNERWSKLRDAAARIVAGAIRSSCENADHWGGANIPRDHERMTRAVRAGRWRIVRCGLPTRNTFARTVSR